MNLFVYGSLLDDAQVRAVCGRVFPKLPGRLTGFRRNPGEVGFPYPFAQEEPGEAIEGMVLRGLDSPSLSRLDDYEGACYERRLVRVDTGEGRQDAWVYVGRQERLPEGPGR